MPRQEKSFIERCADKYDPIIKAIIGKTIEEGGREHGFLFCNMNNSCLLGKMCVGETCEVEVTNCEEGKEEGMFHTHRSGKSYLRPSTKDLYSGIASNHSFGVIGNDAGIIAYKFKKNTPQYQRMKRQIHELIRDAERFEKAQEDFNDAAKEGLIPKRELDEMHEYMDLEWTSLMERFSDVIEKVERERRHLIEPVKWKKE